MWKFVVAGASTLIAVMPAAVAHADNLVPDVEQVVAVMAELTDPGRPAASKTDIVIPGLNPDDAATTDAHLNHLNEKGYIPFPFVVTDIQPAPGNTAGATVAAPNTFPTPPFTPCPSCLSTKTGTGHSPTTPH